MSRSPESSDESESAPGGSVQGASQPAPSSDRFSVLRLPGGSLPGALIGKLPGKEPLNPVVFFVSATIICVIMQHLRFAVKFCTNTMSTIFTHNTESLTFSIFLHSFTYFI